MSTQPTLTPQWKEEVNRRIAAHKSRRGQSTAEEGGKQASTGATRAAEAAARVAARYAKAPTYSQMQAEEARMAVRHAEIATKVALEAQAVAETALAEMHAATQQRGPAVVQPIAGASSTSSVRTGAAPAAPQPSKVPVNEAHMAAPAPGAPVSTAEPAATQAEPPRVFGIRWDPDLPQRPAPGSPAPGSPEPRRAREPFEIPVEDWWSPAEVSDTLRSNPIEVGEADPPHANLIHFPRELVATRKVRPQSGPARDEDGQLSIFEVDPATISTEAAGQGGAASMAGRPEWSGIKLETEPLARLASAPHVDAAAGALPVASLGLRLMAAVVDCALILAGFVAVAFLLAHNLHHLPTGKPAELLGAAGLALIGILYYASFFALPVSTPGMMYAGIGLCTFEDQSPTRAQLRRRLVAMFLSILPVGLGLVWALFDEDHLSWHDRFSQTYPRKL